MPNKKSYYFHTEPGANARTVSIMKMLMTMPRVDLYSPDAEDALREHCDKYLAICEEQDYRPGRENFAASLHIPVQTLTKYINNTKGGKPLAAGVQNLLLEMDTFFNALTADGMLNGENNTIGSIFELKNHWGYKDQSEVVTVHRNEALTTEELKALAADLPEVIDTDFYEVQQIGVSDEKEN